MGQIEDVEEGVVDDEKSRELETSWIVRESTE